MCATASAVELHGVLLDPEPEAGGHGDLPRLDGLVAELDDQPALRADEMIVMLTTDGGFVAR
jgi:hypothetical protein